MKRAQLFVHTLLGAMFLIPMVYFFQGPSEASAAPSVFQSNLLITQLPAIPLFDQLKKLDYPVLASYILQKGEDFWFFCKQHQLDRDSIRSSNNLDTLTGLQGTELKIPNRKGTLYKVTEPETLVSISQGYMRGKVKGNRFTDEILQANGYPLPDMTDQERRFQAGTTLFLPDVLKPFGFPAPFQGRISSAYGQRRHPVSGVVRAHRGIDIPKPYGTKVYAARRGVVTQAGWAGGYGNMVEIRHVKSSGAAVYTRYGHLSQINVQAGRSVRPGTLLGLVGSTGISTGPHLHYEVRDEAGRANNPFNY